MYSLTPSLLRTFTLTLTLTHLIKSPAYTPLHVHGQGQYSRVLHKGRRSEHAWRRRRRRAHCTGVMWEGGERGRIAAHLFCSSLFLDATKATPEKKKSPRVHAPRTACSRGPLGNLQSRFMWFFFFKLFVFFFFFGLPK